MQISTLRPGLLVSLSARLSGNVRYTARTIEEDHIEADGSRRAIWETSRVIEDAAEHEEAVRVRSKARSLVTAICAPSNFGLLCPETERSRLTDALEEARTICDRFNRVSALYPCFLCSSSSAAWPQMTSKPSGQSIPKSTT